MIKKRTLRNFQIYDPIFGRNFDVYVGDKELAKAACKKRYGIIPPEMEKNYDGLSAVFQMEKGGDSSFIYLGDTCAELIAHECLHAITNVLEYVGIEFCRATEEVFTYYQAFLIKEINDKLKRRTKK